MIYDLIIVGGGAAGLVCGNLAKKRGLNFVILEMASAGKKIRVTGNGKCNLTNMDMKARYYNSDFVKDVLELYSPQKIIGFFEKLGMKTKLVENRVYPYNESSHTVVSFLLKDIKDKIINGYKVEKIQKENDVFIVNNEYKAKKVFFATGSDATMGNNSLSVLKDLGHTIIPFTPSLVWLKTQDKYIKGLNGIRAKAAVTLFDGQKKVALERGEILFKKDGVSGIAVFMLSAYIARKKGDYSVSIDFAQDMDEKEIKNYDLQGIVRKQIAVNILRQAKDKNIPWEKTVKNFNIKIIGISDKKFAQVMSGGVELKQINSQTMESKLVKGLYIGGECMNIDGQCGGYNLHWAFASAMAAFNDAF